MNAADRYLAHALPEGRGPERAELTMDGRIRVGPWLRFDARQRFDGHAFEWTARAGLGRWRPLRVVDSYAEGRGVTEGTVGGRRFLRADGPDVSRSAAGRAAAESIWMPELLRPEHGVRWTASGTDRIVAEIAVGAERCELTLDLAPDGRVRSLSLPRWGDVGRKGFGPIPFGGEVHAERRFGDVVIPSRVSVGWWHGTPRHRPFFTAEITALRAL